MMMMTTMRIKTKIVATVLMMRIVHGVDAREVAVVVVKVSVVTSISVAVVVV